MLRKSTVKRFDCRKICIRKSHAIAIYQQELARTYYNRGIIRFREKDAQGVQSDFRRAIELLEPLGSSLKPDADSSTPALLKILHGSTMTMQLSLRLQVNQKKHRSFTVRPSLLQYNWLQRLQKIENTQQNLQITIAIRRGCWGTAINLS